MEATGPGGFAQVALCLLGYAAGRDPGVVQLADVGLPHVGLAEVDAHSKPLRLFQPVNEFRERFGVPGVAVDPEGIGLRRRRRFRRPALATDQPTPSATEQPARSAAATTRVLSDFGGRRQAGESAADDALRPATRPGSPHANAPAALLLSGGLERRGLDRAEPELAAFRPQVVEQRQVIEPEAALIRLAQKA